MHGTDLSDSPPSVKLDDFSPKELTQGPPITVTVDETDEDNSPIDLTHALSEVLDESTHHILQSDKPVRGVEEPTLEGHREHVHVQCDQHTHDDDNPLTSTIINTILSIFTVFTNTRDLTTHYVLQVEVNMYCCIA